MIVLARVGALLGFGGRLPLEESGLVGRRGCELLDSLRVHGVLGLLSFD